MKRWWFPIVIALVLVSTHSNCANRWREASTGRTPEEVGAFLASISSSAGGAPSEAQQILNMVQNQGATVYYSEAPGEMGPVHAVTPVDFQYLSNTQYGINALSNIRVFFVDLLVEGGTQNALILQYQISGEQAYTTKVYSNLTGGLPLGSVEDGEFLAPLRDSSGRTILVRSFDVDPDGNLNAVIQLELSSVDAQGNEVENLGQISSMEGFSGL